MTKRENRWFDDAEVAESWAAKNSAAGYVEYNIILNEIDLDNLRSGKTLAIGGMEYGATVEVEL